MAPLWFLGHQIIVESLYFVDSGVFDVASGDLVKPLVIKTGCFADRTPMSLMLLQKGFGAVEHILIRHASSLVNIY
jgi:hypothetical protein